MSKTTGQQVLFVRHTRVQVPRQRQGQRLQPSNRNVRPQRRRCLHTDDTSRQLCQGIPLGCPTGQGPLDQFRVVKATQIDQTWQLYVCP